MPRLLTPQQLRDGTREALHDFQDRKFRAYAGSMLRRSRYYLALFERHGVRAEDIEGIDCWQRLGLPLVRKDAFRDDGDAFELGTAAGEPDAAVASYRQFVEQIGALPAVVPIRSWQRLHVEQGVPAVFRDKPAETAAQIFQAVFGISGVFLSGGSSGVPVAVKHTRLDRQLFEIATRRLHAAMVDHLHALEETVVSATLYPQAPHMGFWMTTWGFEAIAHTHIGLSGAGILPTERMAELALQYGVNVYAGIPSYFRNRFVPALVEQAQAGRFPMPRRIAITLGGEPVTPACRTEVRTLLLNAGAQDVRITGGYGASESRFHLWYECVEGSGYHSAAPDLVACRIVRVEEDGHWTFLPDGEEGLLVQFPLDGAGTVLAGFLLGDSAVMTHERCPHCGVQGPRLLRVGRVADLAAQRAIMGTVEFKIRGATVNLEDLREQLLRDAGVAEVQLLIRHRDPSDSASPDELVVRCAPADADVRSEEMLQRVARLTKRVSELTPLVELVTLDDLLGRGLKFSWLVDQRRREP
ncbi:phenylacetate--CoA ligase family protein [Variovorax sp. PBL-E5]|uniref:phenylacetate--CoA ligase family protein n=1 Tax=Variovorax sp. PBL-E5 TaxID=434014 RepID=UPI0013170B50|nr:hypothetical protein [Variovorax sp. PBL-E5]VTU23117.1 hypothetical protein E5CHR_01526 [Variovorax sp. PBL-E5]